MEINKPGLDTWKEAGRWVVQKAVERAAKAKNMVSDFVIGRFTINSTTAIPSLPPKAENERIDPAQPLADAFKDIDSSIITKTGPNESTLEAGQVKPPAPETP